MKLNLKLICYRLIATFGLVGYIPYAPGTWATALAMVVWFILPWHSFIFHLLLVSLTFFTGIFASETIEKRVGEVDPAYIVIDEVTGIWLTLTIIPPLSYPKNLSQIVLVFLIFRFFDITKIRPIDRLERIGGGFGIMIDDIAAGIFTAIIVNIGTIVL